MKVKLTTSLSGPLGSWNRGDEYECEASEAASLIAVGFAEPLDGTSDEQKAEAKAAADAKKSEAEAAKKAAADAKKAAAAK